MSNMSYCMFENTQSDIEECVDKLGVIDSFDELSKTEQRAADKMYKDCIDYMAEYESLEEWARIQRLQARFRGITMKPLPNYLSTHLNRLNGLISALNRS